MKTSDAGIKNLSRSATRLHAKVSVLERTVRDLAQRITAIECPPGSEETLFASEAAGRRLGRPRGNQNSFRAGISPTLLDRDWDEKF